MYITIMYIHTCMLWFHLPHPTCFFSFYPSFPLCPFPCSYIHEPMPNTNINLYDDYELHYTYTEPRPRSRHVMEIYPPSSQFFQHTGWWLLWTVPWALSRSIDSAFTHRTAQPPAFSLHRLNSQMSEGWTHSEQIG